MPSLSSIHSAKRFSYYRNKLIQELIDKGLVSFIPFKELMLSYSEGCLITKKDIKTNKGNHPCILYFELYRYGCCIEEVKTFIDIESLGNKRFCEYGDFLISNSGFEIERIGKGSAYLCDFKAIVSEHIWVIKHNQEPRYLSYAWATNHVKRQILKLEKTGVSAIHIYMDELKEITVPIPDLNVQKKIADQLDFFRKTLDPNSTEIIHI